MSNDVVIIGGGIVGLATALNVLERKPGLKVCVLEKEPGVAAHQTGNNSGVIHSGLYYKPGSAKAKTCVEGAKRLISFFRRHGVPHDICGKVVVAASVAEIPALTELFRRGVANGVPGIVEIGPERLREIEPRAAGVKALWVPGTGIVDYAVVSRKYAELIERATPNGKRRYRLTPASLGRARADGMAIVGLESWFSQRTGEPVSLLGWSLGRVYAREMAKTHPDIARCAITLGTPFTGHPRSTNAWRVYEWLTGTRVGDPELMSQVRTPPPVPTTSIYSRSDGVVAWHCSLNAPGPLAENIEVPASHVGMGMNPRALYAIADRLAQPIGRWAPFDASGARRWFFRTGTPESEPATAAR